MRYFIIAKELCTGTNGDPISNRVPTCGWSNWKNGSGLHALGSDINTNKISKNSDGVQQLQHNLLGTMPNDGSVKTLSGCWDIGRPADGSNQQYGYYIRGVDSEYNALDNDAIYIYEDRVSSLLVDLKVRVQKLGVDGQQTTRLANFAHAASAESCLGFDLSGSSLRLWTAPALAGRGDLVPRIGAPADGGERTFAGASFTLTPETFNDVSHVLMMGHWARPKQTTTWDNGVLFVDNPVPVPYVTVARTNQVTRTISFGPAIGYGTVTYDVSVTRDNGRTWTTLATDHNTDPVAWDTSLLRAGWAQARVRYGNPCMNGPYRVSAPFQIGVP